MTDIDDFKESWKALIIDNERLREANKDLSEKLRGQRVDSLQQQLARRVGRYRWISLFLPALAPSVYYVLELPLWFCIAYAFFGILMLVVNYMLFSYINKFQLASMAVCDAQTRAAKIHLAMLRSRLVGILVGMPLIIMMLIYFFNDNDMGIIISAIIGAVAGIIIGAGKMIKDISITRKMQAELRENIDGKI